MLIQTPEGIIIADEAYAQEHFPDNWEVVGEATKPPQQFVEVCTAAQGERALYDLKKITDVMILDAIDAIPDEDARYQARSAYKRAYEWHYNSTTTKLLGQLLSLSEADMVELFAYAVTIEP